jgi:hypothetical protein
MRTHGLGYAVMFYNPQPKKQVGRAELPRFKSILAAFTQEEGLMAW